MLSLFNKAESMRGESTVERSNTVALDFGRELFGNIGAIVFACLVAVSCFGAVNCKTARHLRLWKLS
jgi:hypothetical protein